MRRREKTSSLSDNEAKTIIEACLHGHGRRGATEEQVRRSLSWANGVRAEQALLELVLEGKLAITKTKKNGLVLDEITFTKRRA